MAKNSKIEWTHHTFNPWWGCVKVSNACANCYAESWAKRVGTDVWGRKANRRFFSDTHWKQPIKWNVEAEATGERKRVFCASMADVFEARAELKIHRSRLWELIEATPQLDWLLLTKRPQNFMRYTPTVLPKNVWLGVTAEAQRWTDKRVDLLAEQQASIRFLSCEPLLGPIDLERWMQNSEIDWVIAGGESGGKARPTNPDWVRSLRDQCVEHNVAFHFKQWGNWSPHKPAGSRTKFVPLADSADNFMWRSSKGGAGRTLDGRTWDQIPSLLE